MSTFDNSSPSNNGLFNSPPDDFSNAVNSTQRTMTAIVVSSIIGSLLFLAAIVIIACYCAKATKKAMVAGWQAGVPPSSTSNIHVGPAQGNPTMWKYSQMGHAQDNPTLEIFFQEMEMAKPKRLKAEELCLFTDFSARLGSGGFGVVYKGEFPNGTKVAVKVLNRNYDKKSQEQFMAEVGTIGRTYHINLVRLYGFCYDHSMSALVYEFMENGSLDKYLFSETKAIEWEKLYEIAIGTARGIAYLHHGCEQKIIHYDIKPSNVLLDAKFSPKVADFGLAKLCSRDNTHDSITGYKGTPGYAAPEVWHKKFPITYKCDVYSFGILLFEIIGMGRNVRAAKTNSQGVNTTSDTGGLNWFPKNLWDAYEKGELAALMSSCGIEENDREKAERMSMVALWCAQDSPDDRPSMNDVVQILETGEGRLQNIPPPKPFRYLDPVGTNAPYNSSCGGGSSSTTSSSNIANGYKDSTPIMNKYDIQMASS